MDPSGKSGSGSGIFSGGMSDGLSDGGSAGLSGGTGAGFSEGSCCGTSGGDGSGISVIGMSSTEMLIGNVRWVVSNAVGCPEAHCFGAVELKQPGVHARLLALPR